MPEFDQTTELACEPALLFEFLVNVANLPQVMPPSPHIEIVGAPARLHRGARIVADVRKLGWSQRIVSEVTWFEEGVGFTDVMVQGPFRRFEHTHRLQPALPGCRMSDHIQFDGPGGLLGWYLTNARIERELTATFAYRAAKFRTLLAQSACAFGSIMTGAIANPTT